MKKYRLEQLIEIFSQNMEQYETALFRRGEFANLTLAQIHYLDTIAHLGNPTVSELALAMKVSKPTATQTMDKLVAKGFVRRVSSETDRRVRNLHLTAAGQKLTNEHDSMHREYAEFFRQALNSEEVEMLENLLDKVVDRSG
ncbi:MAG: MarR family transcriptional regulator [Candidatus Neomarinimicrobiota bacterium]